MTEEQWLACKNPAPMFEFFRNGRNLTERKARLFAVACCRRIWPLLTHEWSRQAVEICERYADGLASQEELGAAHNYAYEVLRTSADANASAILCTWATSDPNYSNYSRYEVASDSAASAVQHRAAERVAQAASLRDLLAFPVPPTLDPSCLSGTVVALAEAIYDERAFDRLPVLADALEDGGCTNQDILSHCRTFGEHVRGCWVVDLILSKDR